MGTCMEKNRTHAEVCKYTNTHRITLLLCAHEDVKERYMSPKICPYE